MYPGGEEQVTAPPPNYMSILTSDDKGRFIRNNGATVNAVDALRGKSKIGIYFSKHWWDPCRIFTRELGEAYRAINERCGGLFEVVLVSGEEEPMSFCREYFKDMPWLAVPFEDKERRDRLHEAFGVDGAPHCALIDGVSGELVQSDCVGLVYEFAEDAFPFTEERVKELKRSKEDMRRNQSFTSLLCTASRDYLLSPVGTQVKVSELEGKMVTLYFDNNYDRLIFALSKMYTKLKQRGKAFEVVLVPLYDAEEDYKALRKQMSCLALPFEDDFIKKLIRYFDHINLSRLVLLDTNGKTLNNDLVEVVLEYGASAFPFSTEKLAEFEMKQNEEQTLASILVFNDRDFVLTPDGSQVNVSELEGKMVALYFCKNDQDCNNFTLELTKMYTKLKKRGTAFEVVLLSLDDEEEDFKATRKHMPWFALPFDDDSIKKLIRYFFKSTPTLVLLDTSGKTLNNNLVDVILEYGASAFPFSLEKLAELDDLEKKWKEEQTLPSILVFNERDFVLSPDGFQVKISVLEGMMVALYFCENNDEDCKEFTVVLSKMYTELKQRGEAFEVVLVSLDDEEKDYKALTYEMPWLALPFDDDSIKILTRLFEYGASPTLVLLDANGKTLNNDLVDVVFYYGGSAFPFSAEKLAELENLENKRKEEQMLCSVLVSNERDFVLSPDGSQVQVSELEGKIVALYFCDNDDEDCSDFTSILLKLYSSLKQKGEDFEIVLISLDKKEDDYEALRKEMPWLALPFNDNSIRKLCRYFNFEELPTLILLDRNGKTLNHNLVKIVREHGSMAYPFSPERISERISELDELDKKRMEEQTLESSLIFNELDYVVGKDGTKVLVRDLVGKTVLIYFSAHWCPPCRSFTPMLVDLYKVWIAMDYKVEVVFVSSDNDERSFHEYYSIMPWLALPFEDKRKDFLNRKFDVNFIPTLVVIDGSGRTISNDARKLLIEHGAKAFPFSDERIKEFEQDVDKEAKAWPEKIKHKVHKHELLKERRKWYRCDGCKKGGSFWSFYCDECHFDLHPKCSFPEDEDENEGYICDGEVCRKI